MRFTYHWGNSLAIAVAMWLAAWTLEPLMAVTPPYMTWVPWLVLIPAVIGAAGALLRAPRLATIALQTLGMAVFLGWRGSRIASTLPELEGMSLPRKLQELLISGVHTVQDGRIPLPAEPGLVLLILAVLALCLVAMELLVNGLDQPAWAIAPLVVIYGVGALLVNSMDMSLWQFGAIALGYLLILLSATGFARRARSRERQWPFHTTRIGVGALMAAAATALAIVLQPLVPMGDKQAWLDSGSDAPIQLSDPTVALNENLQRDLEVPVLTYTTGDEQPTYLRIVALSQLTADGAQLVPMDLQNSGLSRAATQPGTEIDATIHMNFPSEYLPVPFVVDDFSAEGRWAYDPVTMSIVATGDDRAAQTDDLTYKVTSTAPSPTRDEIQQATAGVDTSGVDTTALPSALDPGVNTLTAEVTAGAATDGAKVLAIQKFLRSDEFTYTLKAPMSDDLDSISAFLLENRAGYCIHFAAAMVTMARIEGIPARMAIGFTPGEAQDDGSYAVTSHDMHAWPELYFEGLGWVPFEPTKSVASPPSWTDPDATPEASASPSAQPSQSVQPSAEPSSVPPSPSPSPSTQPEPSGGGGGANAGLLLGILAGLAGLVLLLALPFLIRLAQRRWRLRGGQEPSAAAESAWREVRATVLDVGGEWDGSSPVRAVTAMTDELPESALEPLGAVATTVERSRYARGGSEATDLAPQVGAFRDAVLRAQPAARKWRALLLPASLFGRH